MRYAITALIALVLIIFGVVIFTGGGDNTTTDEPTAEEVATTADFVGTDAVVRFTVEGRINAEEEHRAIRFAIDRSSRNIDIIQGYSNNVLKSQLFPNTQNAFDTFIYALAQAGFSDSKKSTPEAVDGLCPNGRRYHYEIIRGGETKVDLWSTSCLVKVGTFAGERGLVETLFHAQIPDYNKIVQGVRL